MSHWKRSPRKAADRRGARGVDAQREKLTGQLGELEAAERCLRATAKAPGKKDCLSQDADHGDEGAAAPRPRLPRNRAENQLAASAPHPPLANRCLLCKCKTQQEIAVH